jgi:hypothetical protein
LSAALAAVLLTMVMAPAVTPADIVGAGPDETPSQAYGPLVLNSPVSGAFVNQSDVDLLSFDIAAAGETRYFTLANTTTDCQDPNDAGCPVYATVMDQTGLNQIGGPTSDAGTLATAQDTETFGVSFPSAGTYYVEIESNGDLPPGTPTYRFMVSDSPSATTVSAGSGGTAATTPPASSGTSPSASPGTSSPSTGASLIDSLHVAARQRGDRIRMVLWTGRAARAVRVRLTLVGSRSVVAARSLFAVAPGRHQIALTLPARLRRRLRAAHSLKLVLTVTATPPAGIPVMRTRRITAVG